MNFNLGNKIFSGLVKCIPPIRFFVFDFNLKSLELEWHGALPFSTKFSIKPNEISL